MYATSLPSALLLGMGTHGDASTSARSRGGGDDTLSRVVSPDLEVWDLLIMMSKGSDSGI